ncbi:hypothetical protein FHW84_000889 [Dyella sp. SG562]|uniref:hypothetical protein n=1 Tax=Dyella sp. SG562 TaxID=2587017 RepID=UPI00141F71F0|nr:hypothetical protein [Dyella sp. SG562]NII72323.1 hypothetical protein [Dyella sp. SG562]
MLSARSLFRAGLFAALAVSTSAMARQFPATGLGQSWPNATDVSSSPRWHVYVFIKDGVRYIQVNDLNGRVRGAFAAANGQFLVLPIGSDAETVSAGPNASALTTAATGQTGETVYRDNDVRVTVQPLANGHSAFAADSTTCSDPVECSTHVQ